VSAEELLQLDLVGCVQVVKACVHKKGAPLPRRSFRCIYDLVTPNENYAVCGDPIKLIEIGNAGSEAPVIVQRANKYRSALRVSTVAVCKLPTLVAVMVVSSVAADASPMELVGPVISEIGNVESVAPDVMLPLLTTTTTWPLKSRRSMPAPSTAAVRNAAGRTDTLVSDVTLVGILMVLDYFVVEVFERLTLRRGAFAIREGIKGP